MPLILRSVKGSKLNIAEMDGNLLYLVSTLSSSLIQVTGSSFAAPNTSITGSFFRGDGRALTNITASFVTASNVYGPYGTSSIASASFAISASRSSTSSYALTINPTISGALNLSGSLAINGVLVTTTLQVAGNTINIGGSDKQIQFNSGSTFSGDGSFTYDYIYSSLKQGTSVIATGTPSHAEGYLTEALGDVSHAEGYLTQAIGDGSHTEGQETVAGGSYSHAEGYQTISSGSWSHAEGSTTIAKGGYSHAEGGATISSGYYSNAEGNATISSGSYSHAEGSATIALGNFSHAEGYLTTASANYSHAGGYGTIANYAYQTVVGQFNDILTPKLTAPFVVGNGTNASSRRTAFAVTSNSSILVATQSSAPGWTGEEGEMVPVRSGGNYYIYVYIGGAWRSSSLT